VDLLEHLTEEHRKAERLMDRLGETEAGPERESLIDELEEALSLHMQIEERFLYPIVESTLGDETEEEAETEHSLARDGLATIRDLASQPGFGAAIEMLRAGVGHHVHEEEHEIFPGLRERAADQIAQLDPEQLEEQVKSEEATRDELYAKAREAGVEGRSGMTKEELADAVARTAD
jgi:hemerythrin-like domain-containing protein